MNESINGLKRSHLCGEVTEDLKNQEVTIMGWVNHNRKLSKVNFITIRDKSGLVQIKVDEEENQLIYNKAQEVKGEFVVAIRGQVILRIEKDINLEMKTGKIEIIPKDFRILSKSELPPFTPTDKGVKEDLRLKYRYLDLRRPELQNNFYIRHKIAKITRDFYDENDFTEIETPVLTRSTPEGARDYLVPSRIYPGNFYALPQSPQLLKQILMISGFDKYYQIVKCFRDEDLRADRQPEFTQIDVELSFINEEDIMELNEKLVRKLFKEILDVELEEKFQIMKYDEAMERFGIDKPDLRFGVELVNISEIIDGSDFGVFQNAINDGGTVRGINAPGGNSFSRKQIDSLVDFAKTYKAKGLAWINVNEDGSLKSTISKFFNNEKLQEIVNKLNGKPGDLILICADKTEIVLDALGNLRNEIGKRLELYNKDDYKVLWITEFPLLEWSEEDKRFYAKHHPFTAPLDEDVELLDTHPIMVRSKTYDLVINGSEAGGGSIRIHQKEIQEKMFTILGFSKEQIQENFGFLSTALKYGVPPHGGIALGLDRLTMLIAKTDNIRDVIAFPKVKDASCPMTESPDKVSKEQLKELGLNVNEITEVKSEDNI